MTPHQFLKRYSFDERIVKGAYYPGTPLTVQRGDRIGVVLFNLGGPEKLEDVEPFLFNLFMDPAIIDIPLKGIFRKWLSKLISSRRSAVLKQDYEAIGGGSPINELTREQASALQTFLNKTYGDDLGVSFNTYIAMRYWHPFSLEAAAKMARDGVTKVVLLPLYPQYSKTTTGASMAYWWHLEDAGEIPKWPTTSIFEYAAHPKYIQAVSERIDEAMLRFPRDVRKDVQLVFSPHGTPLKEMKVRRDPYCCLIHSTIDHIMKLRRFDRRFHVAFQSKVGYGDWLSPNTIEKLSELARDGHGAVLLVPISFVTDHIETSFELDVTVRSEARSLGIEHFEVSSGLNCHPLFIEALADNVLAQVNLPAVQQEKDPSTGESAFRDPVDSTRSFPSSRFRPDERSTRCFQCGQIAEARRWETSAQVQNLESVNL